MHNRGHYHKLRDDIYTLSANWFQTYFVVIFTYTDISFATVSMQEMLYSPFFLVLQKEHLLRSLLARIHQLFAVVFVQKYVHYFCLFLIKAVAPDC